MYLVAGVTGNTGRAAAQTLLDDHQPVTVLVRSAEKGAAWRVKGAQIATASLEDPEALAAVLEGKHGVYFLVPPNVAAADPIRDRQKLIDSLATAAYKSRVPHIVLLSSVGAQHPSGTGPIVATYNAEVALRGVARNLTILRPASFMENWAPPIAVARTSGILPTFFFPNRTVSMIATEDIGRFAADSLLNPAHGLRVRELAGPKDYRPEDIAAALGHLLGRDITLHPVAPKDVVGVLTSNGLPGPMSRLLAELYQGVNNGFITFEGQAADFSRGTITPEEVFAGLLSTKPNGQH